MTSRELLDYIGENGIDAAIESLEHEPSDNLKAAELLEQASIQKTILDSIIDELMESLEGEAAT